MNDFVFDIRQIETQDSAQTIVEVFVESALDQKGLKLSFTNDFFTQCLNNLENPSASPKTKFYTVMMLKELSNREKTTLKIFGHLSKHPLYTHIEQMAFRVDPKKAMQEKGKGLFPGDKATGNNLMRLILQSLLNWGSRFASGKQKKPTRFRQTMDRLLEEKVVLPKNFIYYQKKTEKIETPPGEVKREESKKTVTNETITNPNISAPKIKQPKEKYASEIKFMFNKIDNLLGILQDSDEPEVIEKEVLSYHQKFIKDSQKLHNSQEVMLEGQSEDILHLFFKVDDFLNQEKGLFNLHAQQNDYASYINGYKIAFERIFESSNLKKESLKQQPSIDVKVANAQKQYKMTDSKTKGQPPKDNKLKGSSSLPPSKPSTQKIKSDNDRDKENNSKLKGAPKQNNDVQISRAIETCFSKLQARSKSPQVGFRNIASSLSRQKQSALMPRKKNPMAVSNFQKSRFGANSAAKSSVQLKGIFASPPNPSIKSRNYQGQLVGENRSFQRFSEAILKVQGHRRFKMCHFKTKYILYQDDRIQIGFKCSQIYQKVQKFSSMLLFELYFGNKTQVNFRRVNLNFQGDRESLIYTSPQSISTTLSARSQFKLDLLNIPKSIPYGEVTMQMSFQFQEDAQHISAYLPNSILHMVTYYPIKPDNYRAVWGECIMILKTENFKLSHHFPPDQLHTFIPQINQISSYSQFSRQGSTSDYELIVEVIIQESFQGLLKINIRPDLTVVLQAGLVEKEQNSLINFKFYVQSLASILKESSV